MFAEIVLGFYLLVGTFMATSTMLRMVDNRAGTEELRLEYGKHISRPMFIALCSVLIYLFWPMALIKEKS